MHSDKHVSLTIVAWIKVLQVAGSGFGFLAMQKMSARLGLSVQTQISSSSSEKQAHVVCTIQGKPVSTWRKFKFESERKQTPPSPGHTSPDLQHTRQKQSQSPGHVPCVVLLLAKGSSKILALVFKWKNPSTTHGWGELENLCWGKGSHLFCQVREE